MDWWASVLKTNRCQCIVHYLLTINFRRLTRILDRSGNEQLFFTRRWMWWFDSMVKVKKWEAFNQRDVESLGLLIIYVWQKPERTMGAQRWNRWSFEGEALSAHTHNPGKGESWGKAPMDSAFTWPIPLWNPYSFGSTLEMSLQLRFDLNSLLSNDQ